jgi:hypothetical protein
VIGADSAQGEGFYVEVEFNRALLPVDHRESVECVGMVRSLCRRSGERLVKKESEHMTSGDIR